MTELSRKYFTFRRKIIIYLNQFTPKVTSATVNISSTPSLPLTNFRLDISRRRRRNPWDYLSKESDLKDPKRRSADNAESSTHCRNQYESLKGFASLSKLHFRFFLWHSEILTLALKMEPTLLWLGLTPFVSWNFKCFFFFVFLPKFGFREGLHWSKWLLVFKHGT